MSVLIPGAFDRALPTLAIDSPIRQALADGAWVVFNLSGGKDSGASAHAVSRLLDSMGHPASHRLAVHADLGRAEWDSTPAMVEAVANHIGVPLFVVRRKAGDMVARWEQRFANGKTRYEALETYNLIGPWSSSSLRFCTSELKAQVIGPELARRLRGQTIISVVGIRRDESQRRRNTPVSKIDTRFAKPGNRYGTRMLLWHPLVDWKSDSVFACHAQGNVPLHEAYHVYGATGSAAVSASSPRCMTSPYRRASRPISTIICTWSEWKPDRPSPFSPRGGWPMSRLRCSRQIWRRRSRSRSVMHANVGRSKPRCRDIFGS